MMHNSTRADLQQASDWHTRCELQVQKNDARTPYACEAAAFSFFPFPLTKDGAINRGIGGNKKARNKP